MRYCCIYSLDISQLLYYYVVMSHEKRITLWFITIHEKDMSKDKKCLYDSDYLKGYLMDNFKQNSEIYFIFHNADEEDNCLHIHITIKLQYNCGKTFSRMKQLFPQSHIEETFDFDNSVLYLTHETIKAKQQGKVPYDRALVVNVFNTDIEKYYNREQREVFDFDKMEEYYKDGYITITQYGRRFGYSAIASKWNVISEIIYQLQCEYQDSIRVLKKAIDKNKEGGFYEDNN